MKSILVIPREVITNLSSFEDETGDRFYEIPAHLLDRYTQDTTELLEALENIGNELVTIHSPNISQYKINGTMEYNKLYNALGGKL